MNRQEIPQMILTSNGYDKATVLSAIYKEKIDGFPTLEMDIVPNIDTSLYVKEENIIGFQNVMGTVLTGAWKFFVIKEIEYYDDPQGKLVHIYCEDYAMELLDYVCRVELKDNPYSVLSHINAVISGTRWSVHPSVPPDDPTHIKFPQETKNKSVLEVLQIIAQEYGLHLVTDLTYYDGAIQGRYVTMKAEIGEDRGVTFEYNFNLDKVQRTVDSTHVKTAIIPVGGVPDGSPQDTPPIDIKSVVWTYPSDPENKPLNQDWIEDTNATALWGFNNPTNVLIPRFMYYQNDNITVPADLAKDAWNQLQQVNAPLVNYKVTVADLFALSGYDFTNSSDQIVRLGDIVNVIDRGFLQTYVVATHVISREVDLLDAGSTKLEMGNAVKSIASTTSSLSGLASSSGTLMKLASEVGIQGNNISALSGEVVIAQTAIIGTARIEDASITTAKIVDAQITTAKIGDAQITNAKIDRATANKLVVVTADIQDASVTNAKIGNLAVTTAKIGDAQITNAKIDRISADKLVVNTADIGNAQITTAKIANGAITTALIGTGAIQTAQISDGSITDAKIVGLTANKITAGTIDANNVTLVNLKADSIVAGSLTIDGTNYLRNSEWLTDTSYWGIEDGVTITRDATVKYDTSNTIKFERLGQATITTQGISSNFISVGAGMPWVFTCYVRTDDYTAFDDIARFMILCNQDSTQLQVFPVTFIPTANNVWTRITVTGITPANTNKICVKFRLNKNGRMWVARPMLQRGNIASEWKPHVNEIISAGAIGTTQLATGAVTTTIIANGAVTNTQISANTITGDRIVADAITAREIASKTITANEILANTITGAEISANTITGSHIQAGSITATQIDATNLHVSSANVDGAITSSRSTTLSGGYTLSDLYYNSNGGLLQIYDNTGLLNVKLGSENGTGANNGGTLILYNDSATKPRVELGIEKTKDAGAINLKDTNGTVRMAMYARNTGTDKPSLIITNSSGTPVSSLTETSGTINNQNIATYNWVASYDLIQNYISYTGATNSITTETSSRPTGGDSKPPVIYTEWLSLSVPALGIDAYSAFDNLALPNASAKWITHVNYVQASSLAHEIAVTVVNWGSTSTSYLDKISLRVRNISGASYAGATVKVCVMIVGYE